MCDITTVVLGYVELEKIKVFHLLYRFKKIKITFN